MAAILRLAVVDPVDATRQELTKRLIGVEALWLEAECERYDAFLTVIVEQKPDVALVSLDASPDRAIALIDEIHREAPDCAICVLSSTNDGDRILKAMRAGADEFLTLPVDIVELVSSLKRIAKRTSLKGHLESETHTIAVAGTSGGVGSTTIAVNLGVILGREHLKSAVLVDLDLALGDSDVYLDLKSDAYTLSDLAENYSRLDVDLLQRSLTKSKYGLSVLPRPKNLSDSERITVETLHGVVPLLQMSYSHVLIDVSKAYNALDLTALRLASVVLLVTQLNLPNLRNIIRLLRVLQEEKELCEKIKIVVNRHSLQESPIRRKKAEEIIGREIFWELPNEYAVVAEGCNNGVPLIEHAPRAAITRSLVGLAGALGPGMTSGSIDANGRTAKRPSQGWFRLWSRQSPSIPT